MIIFYSLRFETSLFVTSYDSQSYGGGIRPRLHTGLISLDLLMSEMLSALKQTLGVPIRRHLVDG
jgi:hypothetical protein